MKLVLVDDEGNCHDVILNIATEQPNRDGLMLDPSEFDEGNEIDAEEVLHDLIVTIRQMKK